MAEKIRRKIEKFFITRGGNGREDKKEDRKAKGSD